MTTLIKREKVSKYLGQILDTSPEGISITDFEGTILYLNNKYEQLTSLKREDLLGKSVQNVCKRGDFDFVVNPEVVKSKKAITGIQTVYTGKPLFLDGYPIFDKQGKVVLVVTFIRDMTAIQKLKMKINSQQELLEAFQFHQSSDETKYPQLLNAKGLNLVYSLLKRIAHTDATVLVLGETGVGKGVFARNLHQLSYRCDKPFIKADCSCIPENLIESELFGYESGAFSGASVKGKAGFFEMADTGTLFLDEIGDLPLQLQTKLLGVLQDLKIVRIGSVIPKKVDVRIVAATNKDLEKEVEAGRFRSDLFYRLKVGVIKIPPLRERPEDILPLIEAFLDFYSHKYKRSFKLSPKVKDALIRYNWPGNVREIENLILSMIVTCEKNIAELKDLPAAISLKCEESSGSLNLSGLTLEDRSLREIMGDLEKRVVLNALKRFGSISKTAEKLKVDRTTIFRKLKKFSE